MQIKHFLPATKAHRLKARNWQCPGLLVMCVFVPHSTMMAQCWPVRPKKVKKNWINIYDFFVVLFANFCKNKNKKFIIITWYNILLFFAEWVLKLAPILSYSLWYLSLSLSLSRDPHCGAVISQILPPPPWFWATSCSAQGYLLLKDHSPPGLGHQMRRWGLNPDQPHAKQVADPLQPSLQPQDWETLPGES